MSGILDLGSIIGPSAFKDWCTRQDPVLDPDEAASWVGFMASIKGTTGNTGAPGADGLTQAQVDARVVAGITGKQDTLTFDTAPTASSTNPVTSGGVKTALDGKQDTLTFDTAPTADSTNPVTSGGVKTVLDALSLGDTGWVEMTMSEYVQSGVISYRVKNGVLFLAGTVVFQKMTDIALTTSSIPEAYRPPDKYTIRRIIAESGMSRRAAMYYEPDGTIHCYGVVDYMLNSNIADGTAVTVKLIQNAWVLGDSD